MTNLINKNSYLEAIDPVSQFYLGQLEGQCIRNMCIMIDKTEDDFNDLIIAANAYDFVEKTIRENYKYIRKNKTNAKKIANYLCVINWFAMFYNDFATSPKMKSILKMFHLDSAKHLEYFDKAADYYSFAYNYLNDKFYNDNEIKNDIKSKVHRLND